MSELDQIIADLEADNKTLISQHRNLTASAQQALGAAAYAQQLVAKYKKQREAAIVDDKADA